MNGKQRVESVMRGGQPDRVPLMCQLSVGHVIRNSGIPPAEFFLDQNRMYAKTLVDLALEYQMDGVLVEYLGRGSAPDVKSQVASITDCGSGQLIRWQSGNETFCPVDDAPVSRPRVRSGSPVLLDVDPDNIAVPDDYRMPLKDLPSGYMENFRLVLDAIGQTHSVHGYVISPFSYLATVYGIEAFMVALLDDPDYCHRLMKALTRHCNQFVDNMIDIGLHAVCITAPFEGAGLISRRMYEEFGLPYEAILAQHCRKRGAPSYIHMCGAIGDRLESILGTGVDGIECLDPPPIGNVDLEDAVRLMGGKAFIKGNIDPVNCLLKQSESEVYEDAVRRISIAKGTKRFILSSACSVSPHTPPENLRCLARAVSENGVYSL